MVAGASSAADPATTRAPRIYALLGTGRLVSVSPGTAPASLGRVQSQLIDSTGSGPFLARSGGSLFVAVPGSASSLYRLDLASRQLSRVRSLPPELDVRALVRGPRSGSLYVVGNGDDHALKLTTLSGDGAEVVSQATVKQPAGTVFGAAIAADETRLAVAYHGDAQGFDLVDPASARLVCSPAGVGGCADGHGGVAQAAGRFFTSVEGGRFGELVSGRPRVRSARLPGNHMLEFGSAPGRNRYLYMVGYCGYTGGVARFDLSTKRVRVVVPVRRRGLCGSRVATADDRLLVLASNPLPNPEPNTAAHIRLVASPSGRILSSIRTAGSIVDLAVVP